VFSLILHNHQQNGLEVTEIGIGKQAVGKNCQKHQFPIQEGVSLLRIHNLQQNSLEVTEIRIGKQAVGKMSQQDLSMQKLTTWKTGAPGKLGQQMETCVSFSWRKHSQAQFQLPGSTESHGAYRQSYSAGESRPEAQCC